MSSEVFDDAVRQMRQAYLAGNASAISSQLYSTLPHELFVAASEQAFDEARAEEQDATASVACPRCEAPAGAPCRTAAGTRVKWDEAHRARIQAGRPRS